MTSLLERELYKATALTFERLAFMFASPETPKEEGYQEGRFEAAVSVAFSGAFGGRMTLAVYGAVLPSIVGNMVGPAHARNAISQGDALGELTNVICGNVLTGIVGGGETFLLEAPRALSHKETTLEMARPGRANARIRVELEGGAADVILNLDREVVVTQDVEGSAA